MICAESLTLVFESLTSTKAMLPPHLDTSWGLCEMPEPLEFQVSLECQDTSIT